MGDPKPTARAGEGGVALHPDRVNIWPGCNTKTALVNKNI